jgi:dihydroflavonol-4-reductase
MAQRHAFITGATGFVGAHVALLLRERGWRVRALRRPGSFTPLIGENGIEWYEGDLRDPDGLLRGLEGCDALFHVAADYRLWLPRPQEIYENNVKGTVHLLDAARQAGIEDAVYTSSVGALGLNPDGSPADESAPVGLHDMIGHYKRSKFLAEREVERFVTGGMRVITVHPSTPVGPGDHKPTPTGKIILDFLNRKMPAYLETGLNFIDVRDVAEGHLLALERGKPGEKYILGNRNMKLAEVFRLLEELSGLPAPRIRLPQRPVLALAYLNQALSSVTRKEPAIPLEGVKMAGKFMFFDASKAVRELGLPQTPVEKAFADAVEWYRNHGYVK